MAVASLQRVKRREKILLVLALVFALSVLRSQPPSTLDAQIGDSILRLQPFGVDGRPVPVFAFRGLYGVAGQVGTVSLVDLVSYFSAAFAVLALLTIYFIYRELFGQRYIGVVALALIGSAPAFVTTGEGERMAASGLLFIALAVYLWLKQRWLLWGLATGLALSSHYASVTVLLPFLSWIVWSRKSIAGQRNIVVGGLLGAVIAGSSYCWALAVRGGLDQWVDQRLMVAVRTVPSTSWGLPSIGVEYAAYFVGYVALALGLAVYFRSEPPILRAVVSTFAVAAPYMLLLYVGSRTLFDVVGVLLWVLAFVSVFPLLIADPKRREVSFLVLWSAPLLILVPLLARGLSTLYLFSLFPLALLACRFLDRTLDGEWLDLWWAAGLPTNWYYRLSKLLVLLVLALSYVQALRLRN